MAIGDEIRRVRTRAGMSQTVLAKKVGVSRGLVGQWETHEKKPGRENLKKIADETLSDISEIVDGEHTTSSGVLIKDPELLALLRAAKRMSPRQRKNLLELIGVAADIVREVEQQAEPAKK